MRGQPPHIGHILTIAKIYDDYDKIILHIISSPGKYYVEEEFIIPAEEVATVFKEIFKNMPKIEIVIGKDHIRDRTTFEDLPPFDIIITENKDFIKKMKSEKPIRYFPRSKIHGFDINGVELRKIMRRDIRNPSALMKTQ